MHRNLVDLPASSQAHPSLVRLSTLADLSQSDLALIMPMVEQPRRLSRRSIVRTEGEPATGIYLLLSGWTASSVVMPDGKRQILKLHLPGDLLGLPGLPFATSPDSIVALTEIVVAHIPLAALGRLFVDAPRIAAVLFLISQEERSLLMDRLTLIGRRDVAGRLAGMLLQLRARMLRQDPLLGNSLRLPLTQVDFADMIGATNMHINRVMKEFKRKHILTWSQRHAVIHDLEALHEIAGIPQRVVVRNHGWLPDSS